MMTPSQPSHRSAADRALLQARPASRRSRKQERGAAVFVVMMALLMLSALGVWSMHGAAQANRASGFSRAALQTQYVAELGILTGTALFSLQGVGSTNLNLSASPDRCESVPINTPCWKFPITDISRQINNLSSMTVTDETNAQGSFSPYANQTQGYFSLEFTDPVQVTMPGFEQDSPFRRFTVTSYGMVRPFVSGIVGNQICSGGADADPQNSAAGRLGMRAHVIAGPL